MTQAVPLRDRLLALVRRLPERRLRELERWFLEYGSLPPPTAGGKAASSGKGTPLTAPKGGGEPPHSKDWPHAPLHRLSDFGTYMVTAGTLGKEHHFRDSKRLDLLEAILLGRMKQSGWQLAAWAVFSNHYHFVAHSTAEAVDLRRVLNGIHSEAAREINRLDGTPQRRVWHNYWDTELTFQQSYFARLNYVHQNGVRHGLVAVACHYRWCSAAWFERTASPAHVRTVYSFKTERLKLPDDYSPV